MLFLTFSNRFEELEKALLEAMREPPGDLFTTEHVIVPGYALWQHCEQVYAREFGIAANIRYQYLATWLWSLVRQLTPLPDRSPFAVERMEWRLYRLLGGDAVRRFPSARLHKYLDTADEAMRFELAAKTAALFDQYGTYRPKWLEDWSKHLTPQYGLKDGAAPVDAEWQAALWKELVDELGLNPFEIAGSFFNECESLAAGDPRLAGFPARAFVYCPPTIPTLNIRFLDILSRWIDIHVFTLNPCREFWFDIVDEKRRMKLAMSRGERHFTTGNGLLAAWGVQAKSMLDLLLNETQSEMIVDDAHYAANEAPTILAALQNGMLDLNEPRGLALSPDDSSIEIHVCHSLTRQLEALHDRLLTLLEQDASIRLSDILVATPKLAEAAPLIDAVFGTAPEERRIAYVITGLPPSRTNAVARAVLALLDLARSRVTAPDLFAVLQEDAVARAFDFGDDDMALIREWIAAAGFRWGIDAAHRASFNLPATHRHTLDYALQRLFMGYAMPDGADRPVGGVLPCARVEGREALAFGRLHAFCDGVIALHEELRRNHEPDEWRALFMGMLDVFLAGDPALDDERRSFIAAATKLADNMIAGNAGAVPLAVIRPALESALDDPARGAHPSGAVTFTSLQGLRGMAFNTVCLLGMDDGAFPASMPRAEFDLMAGTPPQKGDRQRQTDDRNLFLDLLLAARDRLIITYTGRGIRDNAPLPPSVLVSELLDEMIAMAAPTDADEAARNAVLSRFITHHPLQAFSRRYFQGESDLHFRSHDREYCEAARAVFGGGASASERHQVSDEPDDDDEMVEDDSGVFFTAPLSPPPAGEFGNVSLDTLGFFFFNTSRALLQDRLGIVLPRVEEELENEEPLSDHRTIFWSLSDRLLHHALQGYSAADLDAMARAGAEYPDGGIGDTLIARDLRTLGDFSSRVKAARDTAPLPDARFTLEFALEDETWRLGGVLSNLTRHAQLSYRCGVTSPATYLPVWLRHLVLNCVKPEGMERYETRHLSLHPDFVFAPVDNARELLADLMALYREGLMRVVHFFPKSSWAFDAEDPLMRKSRAAWEGNEAGVAGESVNAWRRLAMRGESDPLGGEFRDLATRVLGPLRDHLTGYRA